MKVHLIKKQTIEDYVKANAQSRVPFEIWFSIIRRIEWNEPNDIISTFNSADILGNGSERVVFNIGGNKFRLILSMDYGRQACYVKFIGTHRAYDAIDAETI